MASSDNVLQLIKIVQPLTLYATIDQKLSASIPKEKYIVYDFDDSSSEFLDHICKLDGYDGGGINLYIYWSSDVNTASDVVWNAAIRRISDGTLSPMTGYSYDYNTVIATVPAISGSVDYAVIPFSDGNDMDDWANGELALVRLYREGAVGGDTMGGDACLWGIGINEQ
jgi:hypothetical protein